MTPRYAELQVTSHFSFLRGASSCAELFAQASALGIEAMAVVDRNSLAGVVQAYRAAKENGVRLVVGCRLDLVDGTSLLVYPTDRDAYARLCRLLTIGKKKAGKGKCHLDWSDVVEWNEGLLAVLVPDEADDTAAFNLRRLSEAFADRCYLALTLRRRPNDQLRLFDLSNLAAQYRVPTVVTNDVLYHEPARRMLQDIVTCIHHNVVIDNAGFLRERHADRYLKPPKEMHRLFARYPEALARTLDIVERCRFSLDELEYQYPEEREYTELTPQEALEKYTWEGAAVFYPEGIPDMVCKKLLHELELIRKMKYAPYFLTVNAIVRHARSLPIPILCQGRGSAANSAVCFVLGITSIEPTVNGLLFERFVSEQRGEPPDIDVDFEHERREEVIQWIYETYGTQRSALCATVIRYRSRAAMRDVGRALGMPEDVLKALSSQVWGWSNDVPQTYTGSAGLNVDDRRIKLLFDLARQLINAPRHLSQHPGGFVLTRDRLDDLVPVEPASMDKRQVIEWDKDDIEYLKFMKVDVLALGMLTCMRRAFDFLKEHKGLNYTLATIPQKDKPTYEMISKADTLGTFQIESRAQMSMLPRLRPQEFYDIVIQVAIVRPGPIQGDMVHPYLRRRQKLEKVDYPSPAFRKVLERTLGVPLFQEQAMQVAIECAGFTPGRADELRRAMATFKQTGGVDKFREELIEGMVKHKHPREFAQRMCKQLEGFGSYGFPESHAYSFAIVAYASSYVKCHHPDVFCAALLNSQPMGFYAPAQIVRDAREHGVEVRPVCIHKSRWDCTLEPTDVAGRFAVRLGLRLVKGLNNKEAGRFLAEREEEPFVSIDDFWRRSGLSAEVLVRLAEADAFLPSLGLSRREALWAIRGLRDEPLPLFIAAAEREAATVPEITEPAVALRPMAVGGEVVKDYGHVGLTLRAHPVSFLRESLQRRRILPCAEAIRLRDRQKVETAGIVLVRQQPGSAKGVIFVTIEDETGIANLVVWRKVFLAYRPIVMGAPMIGVKGYIQREGEVVHLVVQHLTDLSADFATIGRRGAAAGNDAGQVEAIRVKSRDFH
ncbi:error-prone DNA polymerase [Shinella curvata]|uniref:Error-prone DNA polymerase n=1 Tax=Shinella curvata TaxID=1817964 RepID=A0ABT8X9Z5_9HYPH|nr:error-prone DNA polymerase [Shinella curvata]MCJ8055038.1 error-prone DNA polymerase [Shinella curvata]MDO6120566.1 error-prone DNA polymerase [Shinella curvata]